MIITISREYGSGGRRIGKQLAQLLNIAYYDREIVAKAAEKSGYPNIKQFYRIFSAREEISPAAYRRIQKQLRSETKDEKEALP